MHRMHGGLVLQNWIDIGNDGVRLIFIQFCFCIEALLLCMEKFMSLASDCTWNCVYSSDYLHTSMPVNKQDQKKFFPLFVWSFSSEGRRERFMKGQKEHIAQSLSSSRLQAKLLVPTQHTLGQNPSWNEEMLQQWMPWCLLSTKVLIYGVKVTLLLLLGGFFLCFAKKLDHSNPPDLTVKWSQAKSQSSTFWQKWQDKWCLF